MKYIIRHIYIYISILSVLKRKHRDNIYSSKFNEVIKIVILSTEWIYSKINHPMTFICLVALYEFVVAVEDEEM